jgi:putative ATP-binding cassette transporter
MIFIEELKTIIAMHRHQQVNELNTGKRVIIRTPIDQVLILRNIDICLPSNIISQNVLIRSLTFTLQTKSTLLISGPSGCGKSSLLRFIAGLQYNSSSAPDSCIEFLSCDSTIFLPQQLHLIDGTLRHQLSYLFESKGFGILVKDDINIRDVLLVVGLEYLIDRYSLDSSEHTWSRILSIGEQQRLMIASALLVLNTNTINCFIFDEVTAGCDEETERRIYSYLYHLGISYISVSHRRRLIDYHSHQLIIDRNNQSYKFIALRSNT